MGFFADSFGENFAYRIFHNKKRLEELGDVTLKKKLVTRYFHEFKVGIFPFEWFSMFNRLYIRMYGWKSKNRFIPIAKVNYFIDRLIPLNRITLFLSGAIVTTISK